jgi:hypothetical protein
MAWRGLEQSLSSPIACYFFDMNFSVVFEKVQEAGFPAGYYYAPRF